MKLIKLISLVYLILILIECDEEHYYSLDFNSINRRISDNLNSGSNFYKSWIVLAYENLETHSLIKKVDVPSWGMDVSIKFLNDSTFCGFNTTNEIAGHYTVSDSLINVDVYGGSKVGQPEWGNMFSNIIYIIESFKIVNDQLILFYNDHKNCVILGPSEHRFECTITYQKN